MNNLTEHKSSILYPVWLREVYVLHPVGHHEQVGPADVRPLVLQLANESFTARPLTKASTGCVVYYTVVQVCRYVRLCCL